MRKSEAAACVCSSAVRLRWEQEPIAKTALLHCTTWTVRGDREIYSSVQEESYVRAT